MSALAYRPVRRARPRRLPSSCATEGIEPLRGTVKVAVCVRGFSEAGCRLGGEPAGADADRGGRVRGLPPGRYAVAAYQDVNGNGELDKVPPGIPTEPYAFSNDVGRGRRPGVRSGRW